MTNPSIVTAPILGFVAFVLSVLSVTTAKAECQTFKSGCPDGWSDRGAVKSDGGGIGLFGKTPNELTTLCCTTPSEPYAAGETKEEREQREARECAAMGTGYHYNPEGTPRCEKSIKVIGKGSSSSERGNTALRTACIAAGQRYDERTGRCMKH
jgi:hypothetical protein